MTDPARLNLASALSRIEERSAGVPFEPEPDLVTVARWAWTTPRKFRDADLSDFGDENADMLERLSEWSCDPRGRNLLIGGPVGVGKSRAAVAACRPHRSVEFWPVVELLDALRPGGPPDALDRVMQVDVLILDDLGAERPTDWTAERLYALVNRRWLEELPTVGTTNLPLTRKSAGPGYEGPTLDEVLGDRMFSRLIGGAVLVRLSGPDRRRTR